MPSISIIVPVYQSETFFEQCINSILVQTFSDFELILVDDGSTDGSAQLCDNYALQDNRIVVLHKENGGVSSARNAGLKLAKGKYIMFCDADDYVAPNWCEKLYNTIDNNPDKWVLSDICRFYNDGSTIKTIRNNAIKTNPSYCDIFNDFLSAYTVNKIYSLDTIRRENIIFDESRKIGEDILFNIEYYSHCIGITFVPEILYYYRHNNDSAMNGYRLNEFEINLPLFNARKTLIQQAEISSFCDSYLNMFLHWLDNTFDSRNHNSFFKKMSYNHKMMNTEEFKYCIKHASGKNDSQLFIKIVRLHNYYIYWLFQKICKFKDKITRKSKD